MMNCPKCGHANAYIGFSKIECRNADCEHFVKPTMDQLHEAFALVEETIAKSKHLPWLCYETLGPMWGFDRWYLPPGEEHLYDHCRIAEMLCHDTTPLPLEIGGQVSKKETEDAIDELQYLLDKLNDECRSEQTRLDRLTCMADEKQRIVGNLSLMEDVKAECEEQGVRWKYGMTVLDIARTVSPGTARTCA
jgi:hypothetical protein